MLAEARCVFVWCSVVWHVRSNRVFPGVWYILGLMHDACSARCLRTYAAIGGCPKMYTIPGHNRSTYNSTTFFPCKNTTTETRKSINLFHPDTRMNFLHLRDISTSSWEDKSECGATASQQSDGTEQLHTQAGRRVTLKCLFLGDVRTQEANRHTVRLSLPQGPSTDYSLCPNQRMESSKHARVPEYSHCSPSPNFTQVYYSIVCSPSQMF